MANTYSLISSTTLGASAASVTFSSIPQTYTDLLIRTSIRSDRSNSNFGNTVLTFNSDTSALYSAVYVEAQNVTAYTGRYGRTYNDVLNTSLSTASTFNTMEWYIPSYTASQNKPFSISFAMENNSAGNNDVGAMANLYRSTTAISSIQIAGDTENFVSGSSFYLYGIVKS